MPTPHPLSASWRRAIAIGAFGAFGVDAAAGLYTEIMRAPDQP